MKTRYLLLLAHLAGLYVMMVALATPAFAQRPTVLTFPDTPCDSTTCDFLYIVNRAIVPEIVSEVWIRDSVSYTIDAGFDLPRTILPGDSVAVPVCFSPYRRGNIVDSLLVVIATATGPDSVSVRLAGRGIGPNLNVSPIVLTFPKTTVSNTSVLTIMVRNQGERPYEITAAKLNIPPPFRLQAPLPIIVSPGDSVELTVIFEPQENGVYSVAVDFMTGCNLRLQIGLNGVTDLIGTGAVLSLTKAGFNPANSEQTACDVARCTDVTITNAGNAPLVIEEIEWDDGNQGFSLSPDPPTPFVIPANGQRVIQVCANSSSHGVLADTLVVTSNSRSSIAFGMVMDVSGSMLTKMQCGTTTSTRIQQSIEQANNFISRTLLHIPSIGIQDQLAINSYSSSNNGQVLRINLIFPLTYITDAARAAAQSTVTGLTPNGGTPTGAALTRMIDEIAKSPLRNRVIVLLTDGAPEGPDLQRYPLPSIIAAARARDVRIFTIGVGLQAGGNGASYLQQLAAGTGGASFDASDNDCQTLQNAFEAITDIVSRGARTYEPFAIKVIAPSIVATPSFRFDSVYVHGTDCGSITLTNIGEGEAIVDNVAFEDLLGAATSEFYAPGLSLPITIPEGEQVVVPVCFTAAAIRVREGRATFRYNNCGQAPASSTFRGAAYATANLRLTDMRIGLPDDIVTLPVYADSSLATYGVNTITCEIRWNSSMLDLRALRAGPAAGGASVALAGPVTYSGGEAVARMMVSGAQAVGSGELVELDFLVLRGNALSTELVLKQGLFEDDNPRAVLVNSGIVGFDSTCFRDAKPIVTRGAIKVNIGDAGPTPATGNAVTIPVNADGISVMTLELYASDGRLVRPSESYEFGEGSGGLRVDLSGLASGSYFAILRSSTGETFLRKILVAR